MPPAAHHPVKIPCPTLAHLSPALQIQPGALDRLHKALGLLQLPPTLPAHHDTAQHGTAQPDTTLLSAHKCKQLVRDASMHAAAGRRGLASKDAAAACH